MKLLLNITKTEYEYTWNYKTYSIVSHGEYPDHIYICVRCSHTSGELDYVRVCIHRNAIPGYQYEYTRYYCSWVNGNDNVCDCS